MPLSTIFQLYRGGFIGGGNRSTRRKPPTCHKKGHGLFLIFSETTVPIRIKLGLRNVHWMARYCKNFP
jgi:hypothetical protein